MWVSSFTGSWKGPEPSEKRWNCRWIRGVAPDDPDSEAQFQHPWISPSYSCNFIASKPDPSVLMVAVIVWAPASFGVLLVSLFVLFCLRGKTRISDRGMCISSLRLVLAFDFATCYVYSFTGT